MRLLQLVLSCGQRRKKSGGRRDRDVANREGQRLCKRREEGRGGSSIDSKGNRKKKKGKNLAPPECKCEIGGDVLRNWVHEGHDNAILSDVASKDIAHALANSSNCGANKSEEQQKEKCETKLEYDGDNQDQAMSSVPAPVSEEERNARSRTKKILEHSLCDCEASVFTTSEILSRCSRGVKAHLKTKKAQWLRRASLQQLCELGLSESEARLVQRKFGADLSGLDVRCLPKGICFDAHIFLRHCENLHQLTETNGFEVGGVLWIENCNKLEKLPKKLEVERSFSMTKMNGVNLEIPPKMILGGGLSISEVLNSVITLPQQLQCGGTAEFQNCSVLCSPENINCECDLEFVRCEFTRLPRALHVAGTLLISNCSFESLPQFLTVEQSLYVREVQALKNIDVVEVSSDLFLFDCPNLEEVSSNMKIGGECILEKLPALKKIPSGMLLNNLTLSNCEGLKEVEAGITITGDLNIAGCRSLERIGNCLEIRGSLIVQDCPGLRETGKLETGRDLVFRNCNEVRSVELKKVGGSVEIASCRNLASIGAQDADVVIESDVTISGCGTFVSFSGQKFTVRGSLIVSDAPRMIEIPDSVRVRGGMNISNCQALREIGRRTLYRRKQWWVSRSGLSFQGCLSLHSLPWSTLKIKSGNFDIRNCASLASIPQKIWIVQGNLEMTGTTQIHRIPSSTRIGGDINARNCTSLLVVDEGLEVSGSARFSGCLNLSRIGEDFVVRKSLFLDGCVSLQELSASSISRHANGEREVDVTGTGLSFRNVIELDQACTNGTRLRSDYTERQMPQTEDRQLLLGWNEILQSTIQSVAFAASEPTPSVAAPKFSSLAEACTFWFRTARVPEREHLTIEPYVKPADVRGVTEFLKKLSTSKEFGLDEMRIGLAKRVVEALRLICGGDKLVKQEIITRMVDSVDRCSDKTTWALNQMQLHIEIAKARGDRKKLVKLGRRVMRLEIVRKHAQVAAKGSQDDVCVYLRFEIELRKPLDLPVSAEAMLYPSYVNVNNAALRRARKEAQNITEEKFQIWLKEWPEWQRQLRIEFAQQTTYESLPINPNVKYSEEWTDLLGDPLLDPIILDGALLGFQDFMRHWTETSMDLNNTPRSLREVETKLQRCNMPFDS